MEIQIIRCLQDNYSYLIIDKAKNIACVIDPSEAKPVIKYLEDKNIHLKYIYIILMYIMTKPRYFLTYPNEMYTFSTGTSK